MAYDLLLHQHTTRSFARGDTPPNTREPNEVSFTRGVLVPAAAGIGTSAAVLLLFLASTRAGRRKVESTYYRTTRRDLRSTQETPAVSMRELVYGPWRDE